MNCHIIDVDFSHYLYQEYHINVLIIFSYRQNETNPLKSDAILLKFGTRHCSQKWRKIPMWREKIKIGACRHTFRARYSSVVAADRDWEGGNVFRDALKIGFTYSHTGRFI